VCNKATPNGCIAEGYIVTELVTFCVRYLDNVSTLLNRTLRNLDGPKGVETRVILNRMTLTQVHQYIVFNSDDFLQLWT
jgi:hypothetical protein